MLGMPVYAIRGVWSRTLCDAAISAAEQHAGWTTGRHHLYPTMDVPVADVPGLGPVALALGQEVLLPAIAATFEVPVGSLSFKDMFLAKYTPNGQPGLGSHTDGSAYSFNLLLSSPSDFEGGGTQFDALGTAPVRVNQGEVLIHAGSLQHAGLPVTDGCRYVLVGFVERGAVSRRAAAADGMSELLSFEVRRRPFGMVLEVDEGDQLSCALVVSIDEAGAAWAAGVRAGDCLRAAVRAGDGAGPEEVPILFDDLPFDQLMDALAGLGGSVCLLVERWSEQCDAPTNEQHS
jgi:hypothetical protein